MNVPDDASGDARLLSVLERYRTLCSQGQPASIESLCTGDAVLAARLRQHLESETLDHFGSRQTQPRPDATPTKPAPQTSRYEMVRKVGEGGMGAVYHAHDRMLKRDVALKVIRPEVLTADMRGRFQTEAEAVATLDHPGIVKVFDIGEWSPPGEGPAPFLALEFIAGGSLADHLSSKPMEVREVVKLVRLLARAMAHAHARGVVHRDLKPDNVLIAEKADEPGLNCALGCPKITDFGLAKRVEGQRQTQTGVVMGTPAYMAPEQAEGLHAGPPADVYALGVILYRLLTGKVPFESPSVIDLLYKVCREEPTPPRQFRPEVPAEVEDICLACMSKNAASRPTAAELATRLEGFCSTPMGATGSWHGWAEASRSEQSSKQPSRTKAGGRQIRLSCTVAITFALVVCVAVAGLGTRVLWPTKPPDTVAENAAAPDEKPVVAKSTPAPLSCELVVKVWAKARGVSGLQIGIDDRAVPLREDEQVQAEVTLSEPAYAYLLLVDGKGNVLPLFPWNEGNAIKVDSVAVAPPARKVAALRSPPDMEKGWELDDTEGLDTFLLLARREPWPANKSLADVLGKVTGAPLREHGEVVVRGWDKGEPVAKVSRDIHRGVKKDAAAIDDQLTQLVGRLSREFEVIRAVQYAHVAKQKR